MKYRSRTEIAAMILQSARTGATKTKIMYKAYMSYTQVKEYLNFLQESNLIKYGEDTQLYSVTEKGMRFLRAYDEISGLVSTKTNGKLVKPVRTGF
jgi:predicted transcriptional regulator